MPAVVDTSNYCTCRRRDWVPIERTCVWSNHFVSGSSCKRPVASRLAETGGQMCHDVDINQSVGSMVM